VEDIRVGVRVAEGLLRDLAQRIARLDGVGFLTLRSGLTLLRSRLRAGRADISHDLLLPGWDRFDRVPNLVRFLLRLDCPLEVQLAVAFLGVALHVEILRRLNGVVVLLPNSHVFLLRGVDGKQVQLPAPLDRSRTFSALVNRGPITDDQWSSECDPETNLRRTVLPRGPLEVLRAGLNL